VLPPKLVQTVLLIYLDYRHSRSYVDQKAGELQGRVALENHPELGWIGTWSFKSRFRTRVVGGMDKLAGEIIYFVRDAFRPLVGYP